MSGSPSTAPPTTAPTTTAAPPTTTAPTTTTTAPTTTTTSATIPTTTAPTTTTTSATIPTTTTTLPSLPTIPAVLTYETWVAFVDGVHDVVLAHPDLMYATYAWWSDLEPRGTTAVIAARNGRRSQAAAALGELTDSPMIRLQECHRPDLEPDAPRSASTHISGDPLYPQAADVSIGLTCLGEVWVDRRAWDPDDTDILDELVPGQR